MLDKSGSEPLEGRGYFCEARLALLPIEGKDSDFRATVTIGAEEEAIALISLHHVRQLSREDVVAAVLALFLASEWVNILDRQVLLEHVRAELTLSRLANFGKVGDRCNLRVLLL